MKTALLHALPFYGDLSDEERQLLMGFLSERVFETGEILLRQGKFHSDLYCISSGSFSVCVSLPGGTQEEAVKLGVGELIGEVAFLTEDPITATVVAREPARCIVLKRRILAMLRLANPVFAYKIEWGVVSEILKKTKHHLHFIEKLIDAAPEDHQLHARETLHRLTQTKKSAHTLTLASLNKELLNSLNFLATLDETQKSKLWPLFRVKKYLKGHQFGKSSRNKRKICLIYSGAVMLCVKSKGVLKKSIAVFGSGDLFVDRFFLPELEEIACFISCEESVLLELNCDDYHKLQVTNPDLFYMISQPLNQQLARLIYIVNRQFVRLSSEYQ